MSTPDGSLPPELASRPVDARRGVPIPFVSEHGVGDDVVVDFVGISAGRSLRCAQERLCGLCGTPLGYWIAFLGGPRSTSARSYSDPPMHVTCAEAAVRLCPHIAVRQHKRAPEHRVRPATATPAGWTDDMPEQWIIGVTRDFTCEVHDGCLLFFPAPFKRLRAFRYGTDGRLVEVAG